MGQTKVILLLAVWFCVGIELTAQLQNVTASKRKKVEVPNYTLFLHIHDIATEYSTKLEYKTDSLFALYQTSHNENLFDFRIRALQSHQHVLYKSDPVIAFLDGWIYGVQMDDYLKSEESQEYLGFGHSTIKELYANYLNEFPESFRTLTGDDPGIMASRIDQFAKSHPITDVHLGRTSIIDVTAQWVGEATIGFKSGVSTLTDALRNISDRINYYTEFTPKLTQWNVERSIGKIMGTDSTGSYLSTSVNLLERITNKIDSIETLVYSVTDTVLHDVDRQRRETLYYLSSERKAMVEMIVNERETAISQLINERMVMETLIREERQAALDQIQVMIDDTTNYSFDRIEDIVDRLFYRLLILVSIAALGLVLAVVAYKKL